MMYHLLYSLFQITGCFKLPETHHSLMIIKQTLYNKKMKRLVLTLLAVLCMTTASFSRTRAEVISVLNSSERFDMSFDMRRLSVKLSLTEFQAEAMEIIQTQFCNEVNTAGEQRGFSRRMLVRKAVMKDISQVRKVLTDEQFQTYVLLLVTTLHNKML